MCWSASASLALGAAGVATATYAHKKKAPKLMTVPLLYFSAMELLQVAGYWYLGECSLFGNDLITFLSYLHIAFQPIFVNMYFLSNHPEVSKRTRWIVYSISLAVTLILLLKIVPWQPASLCVAGQTLCGPEWCTLMGSWHLGWSVPLYNWPLPGDGMWYYGFAAFLVPLFYTSRLTVGLFILTGPVLAFIMSSGNPQEWPAIWCFMSVFLMLLCIGYAYHNTGNIKESLFISRTK